MAKNYDQAYKLEICKRVVEGNETVASIARDVGLHENTIYTWVAKYRQNSVKPFVGSGHVKAEDEELKRLELRKAFNVSQEELATYLDVGRTTIANYERGFNMPSVEVLEKLAQYFGVSIDYLMSYQVGAPEVWRRG